MLVYWFSLTSHVSLTLKQLAILINSIRLFLLLFFSYICMMCITYYVDVSSTSNVPIMDALVF